MLKYTPVYVLVLGLSISLSIFAADVDKRAQRMMQRLDTNQDNLISREEAKQLRINRFQKLDSDADGKLTLTEFTAKALARYQAKRTKDFNFNDSDKDGLVTLKEITQHLKLFEYYDQNRDNLLSLQEMRSQNMPEKRLKHFANKVDSNQDQHVSRDEVAKFRWKHLAKFDANQDNQITLQEWLRPSKKMQKKQQRMAQHFQQLDKNNDETVNLAEFSQHQPRFKRADANQDGQVTLAELQAMLQKQAEKRGKK